MAQRAVPVAPGYALSSSLLRMGLLRELWLTMRAEGRLAPWRTPRRISTKLKVIKNATVSEGDPGGEGSEEDSGNSPKVTLATVKAQLVIKHN